MAILATWLWSTAFVGVKIGLEYHTPFQFAGIRFFISGLFIFLLFGKFNLFYSQVKANWRFVLWISIIQIFAQYALFYSGLNLVPGALGAMLIGASPLFVAIVAHFSMHNDKMTPLKTFSILIGVAGIAVITLGRTTIEMEGALNLELLGIGLLLVNNLVAGYSNVLVSKSSADVSPFVLSSTSLMVGGIMLFLVSIPAEGINMGPFPAEYYVALAWLSFLSAAAFSIWFTLLKRPGVKVSVLNVWKFLIPVSGAILSWILLEDENPDLISVIGMVIIAISLLALNFANRKSVATKSRATPK
ncbi:DMT family transporter [Mariniphaga sediminis]|uniref:DMT family transporter n=1 Tax=Mariniphaga sediminis TaxID=1628158 RepID=UPI00155972FF|nr:DMT family transporter [Mariniphaga sediminis]